MLPHTSDVEIPSFQYRQCCWQWLHLGLRWCLETCCLPGLATMAVALDQGTFPALNGTSPLQVCALGQTIHHGAWTDTSLHSLGFALAGSCPQRKIRSQSDGWRQQWKSKRLELWRYLTNTGSEKPLVVRPSSSIHQIWQTLSKRPSHDLTNDERSCLGTGLAQKLAHHTNHEHVALPRTMALCIYKRNRCIDCPSYAERGCATPVVYAPKPLPNFSNINLSWEDRMSSWSSWSVIGIIPGNRHATVGTMSGLGNGGMKTFPMKALSNTVHHLLRFKGQMSPSSKRASDRSLPVICMYCCKHRKTNGDVLASGTHSVTISSSCNKKAAYRPIQTKRQWSGSVILTFFSVAQLGKRLPWIPECHTACIWGCVMQLCNSGQTANVSMNRRDLAILGQVTGKLLNIVIVHHCGPSSMVCSLPKGTQPWTCLHKLKNALRIWPPKTVTFLVPGGTSARSLNRWPESKPLHRWPPPTVLSRTSMATTNATRCPEWRLNRESSYSSRPFLTDQIDPLLQGSNTGKQLTQPLAGQPREAGTQLSRGLVFKTLCRPFAAHGLGVTPTEVSITPLSVRWKRWPESVRCHVR